MEYEILSQAGLGDDKTAERERERRLDEPAFENPQPPFVNNEGSPVAPEEGHEIGGGHDGKDKGPTGS